MGIFNFLNKKKTAGSEQSGQVTGQKEVALAMCDGQVKDLESLNDGVFSKKMLGDGIVIAASEGTKKLDVFAPVAGELVTVFDTKHAFGIKTKNGVELLVHIGIDTVNLKGKGFEVFVKQGDKVEAGAKLANFDVEYVKKNAPNADVILIITSGQKATKMTKGMIKAKAPLFEMIA